MRWDGFIPKFDDEPKKYSLKDIAVSDAASMRKTTFGTAVGNFTEWYDFGAYSYVVVYIAQSFFPGSSLATLAAFIGLAISFLVRPIGGIIWGLIGDRLGRRAVLASTILLMAGGTFLLGIIPSYASIGIWAPILLFLLRGLQGFSTGGEYVGAITFLSDHAPDSRRGFLTSFLPVGTISGYILGAFLVILLQLSLSADAMAAWGWRIPFLLALPIGFIGLYLRLGVDETPAYEQQQQESETMDNKSGWQQIKETCAGYWPAMLACGGLTIAFNVTNYMLTGYVPTYLQEHIGVAETPALIILLVVMLFVLVTVTFVGRLGDRIGRRPIIMIGCALMIIVSAPMFLLTSQGTLAAVFFGTLPEAIMLALFMGTMPSTLPSLFPTKVRLGATSIGYNITVSAFGGTTPLIAAALITATGDLLMPGYILIAAGIIGAISILVVAETARKPLQGSNPNVATEEEAHKLAGEG
jgi:MHS family proline/betaine transporter-like MFS transporter